MPLLLGALLGLIIQSVGTLVGRVLISLGISYVAYKGIDTLVTSSKGALLSSIGGLHPVAVQLAGVLQIGTCVNIMASAALAKLILMGLTSGALTRMVVKG
jgi:Protein of unknown function (DUF2523)